jgi:FkbM family methyltransferase
MIALSMWKAKILRLAFTLNGAIGDLRLHRFSAVRAVRPRVRQVLFRLLAPRDVLLVRFGGLLMYIHATKVFVSNYILCNYESYAVELFKSAIKDGATILDLGANVGYFSLIAAGQTGPNGKIYAFEPAPDNFNLLTRNIRVNGLPNIMPIQKAVGSESKSMTLFLSESPDMHSLNPHPVSTTKGTMEVECTTIDDFMDGRGVDVIKIDVEGNELHALNGMTKTIATSQSPVLFLELNPACLRQAHFEPEALLLKLWNLGFEVHLINEAARSLAPLTREFIEQIKGKPVGWVANLYCAKNPAEMRRGREESVEPKSSSLVAASALRVAS